MTIYLDLVFLVNYFFDLILLITVDEILKRNSSIKRMLLGALVGEVSIITLFLSFNRIELSIFKFILAFLMCRISFSYKNIKCTLINIVYFYLVGIILGGFVYYIYNIFKMESTLSFKYLSIFFLCPVMLVIYAKLTSKFKTNYNNRHTLTIYYGEEKFTGMGFLDSGNKLASPITGNPVILVEKEYIRYSKLKLLPIPYNALNYHGIVYCFKPDKLFIDGRMYDGVLIGLSDIKFNLDGAQALLNANIGGL